MYNNNNNSNNSMYRIPNRIFVGGIPQIASQDELRDYFSHFGPVKDARIITDTRGNSKGYGFVTYESENDASKVLSLKEEELIFKENKLNIGHAFRKKNNFNNGQGGGGQQGGGHHNNHQYNNGGGGGFGGHGNGMVGGGGHNMGLGGMNGNGGMAGLGGMGGMGGINPNSNYLDSQMGNMHPMGGGMNGMGHGMNHGMNLGMGGMGGMGGMNMN